jgi:uracil-DNA glycosylase
MPDMHRIVRQWLETEVAFGVAEVPLPAARAARKTVPEPTATSRPAAQVQQAVQALKVPPPPARIPQPAPPPPPPARPALVARPAEESLIPGSATASASRKSDMARKPAVSIPSAPAGDIAVLPPLTRQQKVAALDALREELEATCASLLNDICTRTVFGEGDPDANLLFVGEGPGGEEDRTGRPFVGRSGQLLDKMITAVGYTRQQVFIANVVKLRAADWLPDGSRVQDRPPTPEEVARGIPFLHRQIEIIRPKVIVTLGAPAVKHLTGTTEGVMKIRGTWLSYRGIPVMPTYHPSFVLRAYTEENRRKVWEDLKAAVKRIK